MYRLPADLSNNVIKVKIVIACGLNGGLLLASIFWWDVSE